MSLGEVLSNTSYGINLDLQNKVLHQPIIHPIYLGVKKNDNIFYLIILCRSNSLTIKMDVMNDIIEIDTIEENDVTVLSV